MKKEEEIEFFMTSKPFFLQVTVCGTNYHHNKESMSRRWFMGKDDNFWCKHVAMHMRHAEALPRRKMEYMSLERTFTLNFPHS